MKKNIVISLSFIICGLSACQNQEIRYSDDSYDGFSYYKNLSHKNRNMRKWDAPVFADLDQDGWVDILLNNHGYGVQVAWNNQGKVSDPWDIVMGDIHGVTVGDVDGDGLLEVLLSRGGGSGSNARNAKIFKFYKDRKYSEVHDLSDSLRPMRGRTLVLLDGDNDGDLDLINFAFPSKGNKNSENYIYENNPALGFSGNRTLARSYADGQKTFVTDVNNDNDPDILMYGHKNIRAFLGSGVLDYSLSDEVFDVAINDVTGISYLDYDGDGDWDVYLSRGKSFDNGQTFCSEDGSVWAAFGWRGKFDFGYVSSGETLKILNYQSPWPNKRLFIGESSYEYKFEGETYSGNDIKLISSDSLGWPDSFPEKGLYVGYVGNDQWRLAGSSWSPLTVAVGDLKNCSAPQYGEGPHDILLENIGGKYRRAPIDIFKGEASNNVASLSADINNDGWRDIIVMPRGNLADPLHPYVLINKSGGGFVKEPLQGVRMVEPGAIGLAVGVVDIDNDGRLDLLFGNERGKWSLYKNNLEDAIKNNYIVLDFGAQSPGESTWLDASVTMTACGRTQIASAGETSASYSRSYNRYVHFGLGNCSSIDSISITKTNGDHILIDDIEINEINSVVF